MCFGYISLGTSHGSGVMLILGAIQEDLDFVHLWNIPTLLLRLDNSRIV
jgi:hypothetical protein